LPWRRSKVANINKIVYTSFVNSSEFKRWLAGQGATFKPGKGSHLRVYLNGRQSVLPMHNKELGKGLVAAITAVPESLYLGTTTVEWRFPQENANLRPSQKGT
jgi:mRNA interferase HicA